MKRKCRVCGRVIVGRAQKNNGYWDVASIDDICCRDRAEHAFNPPITGFTSHGMTLDYDLIQEHNPWYPEWKQIASDEDDFE